MFCLRPFVLRFCFCNAYSTLINADAYSQNLFSRFASTKFNMSELDITRMLKRRPTLQRLQTLDKVQQFINLLSKYGFSDAQISKMMMFQPSIIITSADRILEPKIKLLKDSGFQGEALVKLLVSNPAILSVSLENELLPKMEFLKTLFQPQEFLIKSLLKSSFIFSCSLEKTLKPSVVFWERWGFQGRDLVRLLRINPSILQCTSLTPAQADLIEEIGAGKESNAYKYIVATVATSRMETLKAKIENLKLCGLSVEEILQVCRTAPFVLRSSKETIREKINFVVEDMERPPNYIVTKCFLLFLNLEKVMRPRFLVWQKINSINGPGLSLYTVLSMPEARFVRNIIRAHPESTTLWAFYENAVSNASKHKKSLIQS